MSDFTRRNEADELREKLSGNHDYITKLEAECKNMKAENEKLKTEVEYLRKKEMVAYRDGMIDGLKYAMRCNGVSGGEVQ